MTVSGADVRVTAMTVDRLEAGAALCARAFNTYPQWVALWPRDDRRRARVLFGLYRPILADAVRHGVADVALLDGREVGVTAWLPPHAWPMTVRRQLPMAVPAAKALAAFPRRARHWVQTAARIDAAHPERPPHWYLATVAVDPDAQRRGIGNRLVRPRLEGIDRDGHPCYLETADPANVAWYGRLGFDVRERVPAFDGGPPVTTMWRRPGG